MTDNPMTALMVDARVAAKEYAEEFCTIVGLSDDIRESVERAAIPIFERLIDEGCVEL